MINRALSGQVLIVDEDRGWREELAGLLDDAGYEVSAVATSAEALRLAEEKEFDLAVIDYGMPFVGRVDLFRRLRWRCPKMRGIFLTEQSSAYGTSSALSAGVERVVDRAAVIQDSAAWLEELVGAD